MVLLVPILAAHLLAAKAAGQPAIPGARPFAEPARPALLFADSVLTLSELDPGWIVGESGLGMIRRALAVEPDVWARVTLDSATGTYAYSYRVWNRTGATSLLWRFALAPVLRPAQSSAPDSAWSIRYGYQDRRDALAWTERDPGAAPGRAPDAGGPAAFAIPPGDSAAGFTIIAFAPPAAVSYFAQGQHTPVQTAGASGTEGVLTLFQLSLTGVTVGPATVPAGTLPAATEPGVFVPWPAQKPARGTASATFYLPAPNYVRLAVHDAQGRVMQVLARGHRPAGYHSHTWRGFDGRGFRVPLGTYQLRFEADGVPMVSRKLVVVP